MEKKKSSINGLVPSHFIVENYIRFQSSRPSPDSPITTKLSARMDARREHTLEFVDSKQVLFVLFCLNYKAGNRCKRSRVDILLNEGQKSMLV